MKPQREKIRKEIEPPKEGKTKGNLRGKPIYFGRSFPHCRFSFLFSALGFSPIISNKKSQGPTVRLENGIEKQKWKENNRWNSFGSTFSFLCFSYSFPSPLSFPCHIIFPVYQNLSGENRCGGKRDKRIGKSKMKTMGILLEKFSSLLFQYSFVRWAKMWIFYSLSPSHFSFHYLFVMKRKAGKEKNKNLILACHKLSPKLQTISFQKKKEMEVWES